MREKANDLVEQATVRQHFVDMFGRWQQTATVDKSQLQRLRLNMAGKGRNALTPFIGWMIRELGFELETALQVARRVWTCFYENPENPADKISDYDLSWSYRKKLFDDLRKWTAYLMQADEIGEIQREIADQILPSLIRSEFWVDRPPEAIIDRYRLDLRSRRSK